MKQFASRRTLAKSLFDQGIRSPSLISKYYDIPYSTAKRYLKRLKNGESLEDRPRSGRPRKLTSRLRRQLAQIKSKHPKKSSGFYARYLSKRNVSKVGVTTVQSALHQLGYRWRLRPRRRLTSSQKASRLAFARTRLHESWEKRWFFDESYFNLYRHGNRYWVRVSTDDAMSLPKLSESQEKVSVGIAVAIRHGKKSDLAFLPKNWNAKDLVHAFDTVIYPSLNWSNRIGKQNELVIDNDGRHFSDDWVSYVAQKRLRPIRPWPANSPDYNVEENAFAWLKAKVEGMEPRDEQSLREAILKAWNDFPLSMTETLVESMPRRLQQAIALKGSRTKY
jgi:transposase